LRVSLDLGFYGWVGDEDGRLNSLKISLLGRNFFVWLRVLFSLF